MFILAFDEQIKYLRKLHYGSAFVLIAFRFLKTNVRCLAVVGLIGAKG